MAIEIINQRGEVADLNPGTSIHRELNNALFLDDDKFGEDITYEFELPNTAHNQQFFGNGHLVESLANVYTLPITFSVNSQFNYSGELSYRFDNNKFMATLLLNFGYLAAKLEEVKLYDIYVGNDEVTITPALMMDTCRNPQNYPYIFVPVSNDNWKDTRPISPHQVNSFNYLPLFKWFEMTTGIVNEGVASAQTPFFKLKYILEEIAAYLKLQPVGGFMNSEILNDIYVYSNLRLSEKISEYSSLWPAVTIAEFFKLLKARFRIAVSFDIFKAELRIETPETVLNESPLDITSYISKIVALETPKSQGYSINLRPDNTDAKFKNAEDESIFEATNVLVVGKGEKAVELGIGTLKTGLEGVNVKTLTASQRLVVNPEENASFRLFKYLGLVDGVPSAESLELTEADAYWYTFLNDSKVVKIQAHIPIHLLYDIKSSQLFSFVSQEGFYSQALLRKLVYTNTNEQTTLIPVELECQAKGMQQDTNVSIRPTNTSLTKERLPFKAYFPSHISEVNYQLYFPVGTNVGGVGGTPLTQAQSFDGTISESTDEKRGGGQIQWTKYIQNVVGSDLAMVELRVFNYAPLFVIVNGSKYTFTKVGNYWVSRPFDKVYYLLTTKPIWMVF